MEQAQEIKDICINNKLWVATAESLTAGHLQSMIASVSGASDFFCGGITAYNIDQKVKHLGVDRAHAEPCKCVSLRVAKEMALGAAQLFGADIGVSTTGFAETSDDVRVAHAYYAIWDRRRTEVVSAAQLIANGEGRVSNQRDIAEQVLGKLLDYLCNPQAKALDGNAD